MQIIQSANHTGYRQYRLQTIQFTDTVYRLYSLQIIKPANHVLSADHTVYRIHSLQTIWSVSSFSGAIGLGISFPASPEKTALPPPVKLPIAWGR